MTSVTTQQQAVLERQAPHRQEKGSHEQTDPTLPQLLGWLTGITRPVHRPLLVSTVLRLVNLTLDIVLFGLAAGTVVAVGLDGARPGPLFGWLALTAILKASAYYLEQLSGHYVAFQALELLRTAVFAAMWPKAPGIVAKSRSGDILASLTRDVDRIEVVYAHTFAPVVSAVIVPTSVIVVTGAVVGWPVVIVPAIAIALGLLVIPFLGLRASLDQTGQTLELRRDLAHHLTDSVFGVEEVVGYGRQSERIEATNLLGRQIADSARGPRSWAAFRRSANMSLMLASAVGIAAGGMNQGLSMVAVVALTAGSLRLFEGPRGVEDAAGYLDHSLAAAKRLWHISHAPEPVVDGDLHADKGGDICFTGVDYAYEPDSFALQDLNLTIPAGSRTVFVGPSGSGKSAAVQLLQRYYDPNVGTVLLDGTDIRDLTLDSLRTQVVSVSQRNELLDTSVRENLLLGTPEATEAELWEALRAVHIDQEIRSTPDGLDTKVGAAGRSLSGGQAQRLCLARALLMKPSVLVLDEFTANLNLELEEAVRADISRALPDSTIVEVTHRLESALDADQIVLMDRGRVAAVGAPGDLARKSEFFGRALMAGGAERSR